MSGRIFHFKDFSVSDAHCGQKVCSDAVLFGAWAWRDEAVKGLVLDIGAGSGILSLLTARACPEACVYAIEIDDAAATDASENFVSSPWSERLHVFKADYRLFPPTLQPKAIICNPPFFSTGAPAEDSSRAAARHEASLSYEGAIKFAAIHLGTDGRLMLIGPAEREKEIVFAAELAGLKLRRRLSVRTVPRKAAVRACWEFRRQDGPIKSEEVAVRDDKGIYTKEYLNLIANIYHHL
ncbi:MAG: methyltransferase [Muribaculaceae bacterium]|nr:methyltransferase [Muribaculaceae bacterium]